MNVDEAERLRNRMYKRLAARRPEIEKSEGYYRGEQPLAFATDEWRKANAARYSGFSDNWCGTIVNAEAERLDPIGVTGFAGAESLWNVLRRNEFDSHISQGLVSALTSKRSFVMVWADSSGEPLVTVEHPSQVEIEYDWENPRLRQAALKTWVDDDNEFATLYTSTEVWKWQRKRSDSHDDGLAQALQSRSSSNGSDAWEVRQGPRDDRWPIANTLGEVPVVEIANRPTLLGEPVSEIQGVIPMQDAINLLWAYLFLSADYASMPARVLLGTAPPMVPMLDSANNVIGERPADMKDLSEKRLTVFSGPDAKIDSWDPSRLDVFTDTIEVAVGHIAAQTRTPPHYLVSNKGLSNLSGDALTAAEISLVQKANEFITFTNPSLREVLRLVALVQNRGGLAEQARLATIVWKNREVRSDAQLADALVKKRNIGYPFAYLLEEEGKDPATIRRIMEMREAELGDPMLERALRPFGGVDGDTEDGDPAV